MFVGQISEMHPGMTRGPQIASSADFFIITAMDKSGDIHFFQFGHAKGEWANKSVVNNIPSSAPEGLMSIAADKQDSFHAVWLDIRQGKRNNICFSSLSGKEGKWTRNRIINTSPDEHVSECCRPNIAVEGSRIDIMFRNWLNGSGDLSDISVILVFIQNQRQRPERQETAFIFSGCSFTALLKSDSRALHVNRCLPSHS